MQNIERAAGAPFAEIGMLAVAEDDPPAASEFAAAISRGLCWITTIGDHPGDATPVAYLLAGLVDGTLHIEQVSVHPLAARHGLGAALIAEAEREAVRRGIAELTLTTFMDVPWNAAYYRRLGFDVLPEAELGPDLGARRLAEATHELDRWPRVAMSRAVRYREAVPAGKRIGVAPRSQRA